MAASIAFNFSSGGNQMHMTGSGYKSGEEVIVYIAGKVGRILPCDSNGNFRGLLRGDGLASGTYAVQANGNTSGLSASANYTIS